MTARDRLLERVKLGVWVDVACGLIGEGDVPGEIEMRAGMSDERLARHRQALAHQAHDRGTEARRAQRAGRAER